MKIKKNKNKPLEVIWEGSCGCIDDYIKDKSGKVVGVAVVGFGIKFYPMCPHCGEYAVQEEVNPDGNFTCQFCGGIQKPIDWNKRPATILDEEGDD